MQNLSVTTRCLETRPALVPLPLIGPSPAIAAARAALTAALAKRGPVLITAEPGCRAADIAGALHAQSDARQPFVSIDCGAGGSREIEQRLFGRLLQRAASSHLEWVTTDAAIVQVGSGTLYLDNVEELSGSTQRRLARVLRDNEVRLPRSRRPVAAGFRLVASTSRDLEEECRTGRFRPDLLRRLAASRIAVPPLRQRVADIPQIIAALPLEPPIVVTPPAITVLISLPWPRNIDELLDMLRRLAESGSPVQQEDVLAHLPVQHTLGRVDLTTSLREARRQFERDYIAAVLCKHGWSVSDAARTLGIERANLYRKVRQVGLVLPSADRAGGSRS